MIDTLLIPLAVWGWLVFVIAAHESAHLAVGYAVGFEPIGFTVGRRPYLMRRRIGRLTVSFGAVPFNGSVRIAWPPEFGLRWRGLLFSLAGPAMDLIVLLVLLRLAGRHFLLYDSLDPWGPILDMIVLFQAAMVLSNLIPHNVNMDGTVIPNDAKRAWSYLTGKGRREALAKMEDYRLSVARYDSKFELSRSWLLRADPIALDEIGEAYRLLAAKDHEKGLRLMARLLEEQPIEAAERGALLDIMACSVAIDGDCRFLEQALVWAKDAQRLLPDVPTIRGTLGSLLIESGDCLAGLALLEPLTTPVNERIDRAIAACYVAKARHLLGDAHGADEALSFGLSLNESCGVCERIQSEICAARARRADAPGSGRATS